jgi:hypothetical protein
VYAYPGGDGRRRLVAVTMMRAIRRKEAKNPPMMVIRTNRKMYLCRGAARSSETSRIERFPIAPKKSEMALIAINLKIKSATGN